MFTYRYRCTLVSDVILNQRSSSEGPQNTLDFIPGNNFLGIAASYIYPSMRYTDEDKLRLFHTGEVRFSDANPAKGGIRTHKVPSSLYYPKLKKPSDGTYVWHKISQNLQDLQLKQCRNGFYAFRDGKGIEVKVLKSFAIKSAYDRFLRKSKDSQMYGYESLSKGQEFFFEVSFDESIQENLREAVSDALCGDRFIGRSKSAQYGHVHISKTDYEETQSRETFADGLTTVYADARLIFFDAYGMPTFRPTAQDLGFGEDAEIDWQRSQVRTFQYSPWNAKRHGWDTDRCGIEKGSVFVVKSKLSPDTTSYIGLYKNEGFGRVIYNPDFLDVIDGTNGRSVFSINENSDSNSETEKNTINSAADNQVEICDFNRKFIATVMEQMKYEKASAEIYDKVNNFVARNAKSFTDEQFASQWGLIRKTAIANPYFDSFQTELEKIMSEGCSSDKWQEGGRDRSMWSFISSVSEDEQLCKNWRMAVVNLCSEMAKKCKKDDYGKFGLL